MVESPSPASPSSRLQLRAFMSTTGRRRTRSSISGSEASAATDSGGGGGNRFTIGLRRLFPSFSSSQQREAALSLSSSAGSSGSSRIKDLNASNGDIPPSGLDESAATAAPWGSGPKLRGPTVSITAATAVGMVPSGWGTQDDEDGGFAARGEDWLTSFPPPTSPQLFHDNQGEASGSHRFEPATEAGLSGGQHDGTVFMAASRWTTQEGAWEQEEAEVVRREERQLDEKEEGAEAVAAGPAMTSGDPFWATAAATAGAASLRGAPEGMFEERRNRPQRQGTLGVTLPWAIFDEGQPALERQGSITHALPESMSSEEASLRRPQSLGGPRCGDVLEGQQGGLRRQGARCRDIGGDVSLPADFFATRSPPPPQQQQQHEVPSPSIRMEAEWEDAGRVKQMELQEDGENEMGVLGHVAVSMRQQQPPQQKEGQEEEAAAADAVRELRRLVKERKRVVRSMTVVERMLRQADEAEMQGRLRWQLQKQQQQQRLHHHQPYHFHQQHREQEQQQQRRRRPAAIAATFLDRFGVRPPPLPLSPPPLSSQDHGQQEEEDVLPLLSPLQRTAAAVPLVDDSSASRASPSPSPEMEAVDGNSDDEVEEEASWQEPPISDAEADEIVRAGVANSSRRLALQGPSARRLLSDDPWGRWCPLARGLERAGGMAARLVSLELSGNGLTSLDPIAPAFASLKALRRLDLSHNRLPSMRPPPAHPYPPTLQHLVLRHNAIAEVSGLEGCATSLQQLDLAHNHLPRVDGLSGLPRLEALDLSYNRLSRSLDLRLLSFAPSVTALALAGNPVLHGLVGGGKAAVLSLLPRLQTLDGRPVSTPIRKARPPHTATSPSPPRPLPPTREEQAQGDARRTYARLLAKRSRARARAEREAQVVEEGLWRSPPPPVSAAQQRARVEELARPRSSVAAAPTTSSSAWGRCHHRHHVSCDSPPCRSHHGRLPAGGRVYPPHPERRADALRDMVRRQLDDILACALEQQPQPQPQQPQPQVEKGGGGGGLPLLQEGKEEEKDDGGGEEQQQQRQQSPAAMSDCVGGDGGEGEEQEEEAATPDRWLAIVEADAELSRAALQVAVQSTEAVLQQQLALISPSTPLSPSTPSSASSLAASMTTTLACLPDGAEGAMIVIDLSRQVARVGRRLQSTCRELEVLRRVDLPKRLQLMAAKATNATKATSSSEAAAAAAAGDDSGGKCVVLVRAAEQINALKRDLEALLRRLVMLAVVVEGTPAAASPSSEQQQRRQERPCVLFSVGAAPEKEGPFAAAAAVEERLLALPLLFASLRKAHALPPPLSFSATPGRTPTSSSSSVFAPSIPGPAFPFCVRDGSDPVTTAPAPAPRSPSTPLSPSARSAPSPCPTPSTVEQTDALHVDLSEYLVRSLTPEPERKSVGVESEGEGEEPTVWLQGWDERYGGCHFYYNPKTNRSQWARPDAPVIPCDAGTDKRSAPGSSPRTKTVTFSPRLVTINVID